MKESEQLAVVVEELLRLGLESNFQLTQSNTIQSMKTLVGKYEPAADIVKEVFKLDNSCDGLRYDLTTPLALQFNKQDPRPAKRMEFGRVFRNGPVTAYRFKEFSQFDFDTTYSVKDKNSAMLDCLMLLNSVLQLSKTKFTVHVNSQEVLDTAIRDTSCGEAEGHLLLKTIDKLSKHTLQTVVKKNPEVDYHRIIEFIGVLEGISKPIAVELFAAAINSGSAVVQYNPLLVRGLNFYTDLFFEVYEGDNVSASIMSGGFYNLSKIKSENDTPCFGFSIGLNRFVKMIKPIPNAVHKIIIQYSGFEELSCLSDLKIKLTDKIKNLQQYSCVEQHQFNFEVKTFKEIRSVKGEYFIYSTSGNFKVSDKMILVDSNFFKKVINTSNTRMSC